MSQALKKLSEKGLSLPHLEPSNALFMPYSISNNMVYVSGQLPLGFGDVKQHVGQVGKDIDIERAKQIAKICGLNVIYRMNQACHGDLDLVKKCVKITVFVNSSPEFTDQPLVANVVSQLMIDVFGEKGEHARSAIGVSQLPLGVAVEVEAIFEI
ncbi:MAG: RidA family protein [Alphaproteobacteria bacterium]|jgi:enamine deaminase RidA (YjgF/YER057c/UK114 family)|nr:RidA family protein [Candidatus Jidaibacter sp.]